jgi:hypothetical protein
MLCFVCTEPCKVTDAYSFCLLSAWGQTFPPLGAQQVAVALALLGMHSQSCHNNQQPVTDVYEV